MTAKETFYKVLERCEFAYIGHKDVDMVVETLTELEELKRDVARYFELIKGKMPNEEALEYIEVTQRLLKVGEM